MKENISRGRSGIMVNGILCGTVILVDTYTPEELSSQPFDGVRKWAAAHQGRLLYCAVPHSDRYAVKLENCYLPAEVINKSFFHVGGQKAYLGDFQWVHYAPVESGSEAGVPKAPASMPTFAEWLDMFFEQTGMSEGDKEKVLNMSLLDFLGLCKTAAENLEKQASQPKIPGTTDLAFMKRQLMLGKRVKCPVCHNLGISVIEGLVKCNTCGYDFGDIDNLPNV